MTTVPSGTHRWHGRGIAYWASTAIMAGECGIGGAMDLAHLAPFYPMLTELGYPAYLATILGAAKIIAMVVLTAPGLARLKEWAYAGVLINMIGAGASYLATHQAFTNLIPPAAFAALALLSWASRPPARRLGNPPWRNRLAAESRSAHSSKSGERPGGHGTVEV